MKRFVSPIIGSKNIQNTALGAIGYENSKSNLFWRLLDNYNEDAERYILFCKEYVYISKLLDIQNFQGQKIEQHTSFLSGLHRI